MTTFVIKEFMTLLNEEYTINIYGENVQDILNRLLLSLPYLLTNSIDSSIKDDCCVKLSTYIIYVGGLINNECLFNLNFFCTYDNDLFFTVR